MYVCICNAIREKDLRSAVHRCTGGVEAIYTALGRPPQCRQCLDDAEDIVADELMNTTMAISAAA